MSMDPTSLRLSGAVPLDPRPPQAASRPGAGGNAAGSVVDVTEATFTAEVLDRSQQLPVVLDFWASWCEPCKQLSPVLERLATESGGTWVLAKIDIDANPQLAQAAQVQSIPAVKAVIAGQVVGEFNGAVPEAQARQWIQGVVQAAGEMGLPGPGADGGAGAPEAEPPVPAYVMAADEALRRDDVEAAAAAFEDELAQNPGNDEARAGLAQVQLLQRVGDADLRVVREAAAQHPDDVAAQLLAADLEVAGGLVDDGFARLLDVVRRTAGEERDLVRRRLVELFDVVGADDARVVRARRDLTSALF